jgi:hypothetical protein
MNLTQSIKYCVRNDSQKEENKSTKPNHYKPAQKYEAAGKLFEYYGKQNKDQKDKIPIGKENITLQ